MVVDRDSAWSVDFGLPAGSVSVSTNPGLTIATAGVPQNFAPTGLSSTAADATPETLREHIEKIVPLTDEEFAFVAAHRTVKTYKKRQFIFQTGEPVPCVYFVVSGLLILVYTDEKGKPHTVSFAMEDWWESDYRAFYTQTKATMSLQCLEDTEVCCFSLDDYQTLCASLQKIEHFFLQKSAAGHLGSQQRVLYFMTANATERYEHLLKRYPALLQRVPKTLLASYLGVSRETLSRLSA